MRKRGFTLLEVIIVVIIIGLLASIALPQYVNTIEKARSAEAMTNLGTLRSAMERHWFEGVAESSYIDADLKPVGTTGTIKLDVDNPNDNPNKKFNYGIDDRSTVATKNYTLRANRTTDPSTYWIEMDENGATYKSTALGGSGTKDSGSPF